MYLNVKYVNFQNVKIFISSYFFQQASYYLRIFVSLHLKIPFGNNAIQNGINHPPYAENPQTDHISSTCHPL